MHILLIEDHARLAQLIHKGLEGADFEVEICGAGRAGLSALAEGEYDAVVLDLGLPDMDGLDVLRELRQADNAVPVLILTSRVRVSDRVEGLNAGADDYLIKPFDMNELEARLRALLRRPGNLLEQDLQAGNITLNPNFHEVRIDGDPLGLSRREVDLLAQLMRVDGHAVPKAKLEESLYGPEEAVTSNSLEVMVHRLRKKLRDAGSQVNIHTIRGVGYMLVADDA